MFLLTVPSVNHQNALIPPSVMLMSYFTVREVTCNTSGEKVSVWPLRFRLKENSSSIQILGFSVHSRKVLYMRACKFLLERILYIASTRLIRILDMLSKQKKIPQLHLPIIEVNHCKWFSNLCPVEHLIMIIAKAVPCLGIPLFGECRVTIKANSKGMVKGLGLFISAYVTADSKATELLQWP